MAQGFPFRSEGFDRVGQLVGHIGGRLVAQGLALDSGLGFVQLGNEWRRFDTIAEAKDYAAELAQDDLPGYTSQDEDMPGYAMDPLTAKGEKIKSAMEDQYGSKKGEQVFYASRNAGKIKGVDHEGPPSVAELSGEAPIPSRDAERNTATGAPWDYGPTKGFGTRAVPSNPHPDSPMGRRMTSKGEGPQLQLFGDPKHPVEGMEEDAGFNSFEMWRRAAEAKGYEVFAMPEFGRSGSPEPGEGAWQAYSNGQRKGEWDGGMAHGNVSFPGRGTVDAEAMSELKEPPEEMVPEAEDIPLPEYASPDLEKAAEEAKTMAQNRMLDRTVLNKIAQKYRIDPGVLERYLT